MNFDDPVRHPQHYQLWEGLETIDAIKLLLTKEEYLGYLKGNILKYRLRAGKKDASKIKQDIEKSSQYEEFLNLEKELE